MVILTACSNQDVPTGSNSLDVSDTDNETLMENNTVSEQSDDQIGQADSVVIDPNLIGKTFSSGDFEYTILECGDASISGYIGEEASLTLPTEIDGYSVVAVSDAACKGNDKITSLLIPGTIKEIGKEAFQNCKNLTSVTFEEGVERLNDFSFAYNKKLTEVDIPDSVTNMGMRVWNQDQYDKIYEYKDGLVYAGKVVVDIDEKTFDGEIRFQEDTVGIGSEALLAPETVSGMIADYITEDTLIIPDTVKSIGSMALGNLERYIKSIEIPDSVEYIGDEAIPQEIKIYGVVGSEAERYASSNGNDFVIRSN